MKIPLKEIAKLVDYLYEDEKKHMEECKASGQNVNHHIFKTVQKVMSWMNAVKGQQALAK
jgi:hypothetical protein